MYKVASVITMVCLLTSSEAYSQTDEQDLSQAASDPTASLSAYLLQNFYTSRYHGAGGVDGNKVQFRIAKPYTLGDTSNIFRLTLPYVTDNPANETGLLDATVFNLTTFNRHWGRFGVGAVALLPTGSDELTTDRWALGPAVGFVAQSHWGIWGLFNQNLVDIDGDASRDSINLSVIQPIVNVSLVDNWSVGTSDMSVTYDWDSGKFVSLPLGVQVNKLIHVGGAPVQLGLSYEYNFYDEGISPESVIGLTGKLLVP